MKQILSLLLTILFLCTASMPSVMASEETTTASGAIENTNSDGDTDTDGSIHTVAPADSGTAISIVDEEPPDVNSAIERISIPEGDALGEGLENTISITEPIPTVPLGAITLTHFDEPYYTDAVAFALGTPKEEISQWFDNSVVGFTGYDTDGNSYDFTSKTWSLDAVDTVTSGVYCASAVPDLGTEYILEDGVSLPQQLCSVSIQTMGEPDINCCVVGRGFLHFPWVLSSKQLEQLDKFNVWLRKDGGDWTCLADGFLFVSDSLQLSQRIFAYGSTYQLKVTYPDSQTGILSFQYNGELSSLNYSGGDRDGGDASGNGSGEGTQPSPSHSKKANHSNKDNSQGNDTNATAPDTSLPNSNDTPKNSYPTQESQNLQVEQNFAPRKIQSIPTILQVPSYIQDSKNISINNILQPHTTEKSTTTSSISPTELTINAYSDIGIFQKAEDSLFEAGNHMVPQMEGNTKSVANSVSEDNNITSEKIVDSQVSANITESYSPTQTIISGLRLRDLCADQKSVVFGSEDLTVSIPSILLLALNLSDSDALIVTLNQPENNQILFTVESLDKPVTELAGAVLRLRYKPKIKNPDITIQNEAGEQITDAYYDGELLRFCADAAGTYTIMEQLNTQDSQKNMLPLLPISGGFILAVGGIAFFWRRRHG